MSKHVKNHDTKNHANVKVDSQKENNGLMTLVLVGVATLIIGLVLGAVLTLGYFTIAGPVGENNQKNIAVDANELKLNVENWVNNNLTAGAFLVKVSDVNSLGNNLYELEYEIYQENQLVSMGYFYSDGKNLILAQGQKLDLSKPLEIPKTEEPVVAEMKKTDVPEAELYIWSYCPYGVTALTPFAEAAELLDSKANFSVKLYFSGHGEFETQQNMTQACIQKYDQNKYWSYAKQFVESVYSKCSTTGDLNCDKTESTAIMNSLGIDSKKIYNCVKTEGEALVSADYQKASELGVTGSPTLFVNGTKVNVSRNAESYKTSVCSAFNTVPSECDSELNTVGSTASGSC